MECGDGEEWVCPHAEGHPDIGIGDETGMGCYSEGELEDGSTFGCYGTCCFCDEIGDPGDDDPPVDDPPVDDPGDSDPEEKPAPTCCDPGMTCPLGRICTKNCKCILPSTSGLATPPPTLPSAPTTSPQQQNQPLSPSAPQGSPTTPSPPQFDLSPSTLPPSIDSPSFGSLDPCSGPNSSFPEREECRFDGIGWFCYTDYSQYGGCETVSMGDDDEVCQDVEIPDDDGDIISSCPEGEQCSSQDGFPDFCGCLPYVPVAGDSCESDSECQSISSACGRRAGESNICHVCWCGPVIAGGPETCHISSTPEGTICDGESTTPSVSDSLAPQIQLPSLPPPPVLPSTPLFNPPSPQLFPTQLQQQFPIVSPQPDPETCLPGEQLLQTVEGVNVCCSGNSCRNLSEVSPFPTNPDSTPVTTEHRPNTKPERPHTSAPEPSPPNDLLSRVTQPIVDTLTNIFEGIGSFLWGPN
jgi:hypothetical protein